MILELVYFCIHADTDSSEFKKSRMGFSGSALTMKIKSSQVGKVIGILVFSVLFRNFLLVSSLTT